MGQEQGAQAMSDIFSHMSQMIDGLFQEGQQLFQSHSRLEALLNMERSTANEWLQRTKDELQRQAQDFVTNRERALQQQLEEERNKMSSDVERERIRQTMVSERKLEELKTTLHEDFRRQQAQAQASMQEHCQRFEENCKRNASQLALSRPRGCHEEPSARLRAGVSSKSSRVQG
jgi:F0F1-type ATP synthase membrane subunit b/b'